MRTWTGGPDVDGSISPTIRHILCAVLAALMQLIPFALSAQRNASPASCPNGNAHPPASLPAYPLTLLSNDSTQQLRACLKAGRWADALAVYFGSWRPELADWVVYIGANDSVHQGFKNGHFSDGGADTSSTFIGMRYVWVVVFSEKRLANVGVPQTTPSGPHGKLLDTMSAVQTAELVATRRTVVYQQDPMLTTLIVGLLHPFGASAPPPPSLPDSQKTITLERIARGGDSVANQLFAGVARFGLIENTAVEFAITPGTGKAFPDSGHIQAVYANIANAKRHQFELGVLAAGTYGRRIPTYNANYQVTSESPKWNFNTYITAVWNKWWWTPWRCRRECWREASTSPFIGTNVLTGTIGSQFIGGIALGHVISDAGIAGGLALVQVPGLRAGHATSYWRGEPLLGLELRF